MRPNQTKQTKQTKLPRHKLDSSKRRGATRGDRDQQENLKVKTKSNRQDKPSPSTPRLLVPKLSERQRLARLSRSLFEAQGSLELLTAAALGLSFLVVGLADDGICDDLLDGTEHALVAVGAAFVVGTGSSTGRSCLPLENVSFVFHYRIVEREKKKIRKKEKEETDGEGEKGERMQEFLTCS